MSTFESSYKSLLQGVSQQIPQERKPGQVSAQLNMVSDPVTNIRRRPGAKFEAALTVGEAGTDSVLAGFTDVSGSRLHYVIETTSGELRLYNQDFTEVAKFQDTYLEASDRSALRVASVGQDMYVLNSEKRPYVALSTDTGDSPEYAGFAWVVAGAFAKKYELVVRTGDVETTVSYSTPAGAGAGDAALATPAYIAEQLQAALDASIPNAVLPAMATNVYNAVEAIVATTAPWSSFGDLYTNALALRTHEVLANAAVVSTDYTTALSEYALLDADLDEFLVYVDSEFNPTVAGWVGPTLRTQVASTKQVISGTVSAIEAEIAEAATPPVVQVFREGAYLYLKALPGVGKLLVESSVGSAYLQVSNNSYVTQAGNLPALLPAQADGYVCSVGDLKTPQYFKYNAASKAWLESAKYGESGVLMRMPMRLYKDDFGWALSNTGYSGRQAGDSESNPDPEFVRAGITGIAAYHGRLVLLAGGQVCLSSASKPQQFYRTTITTLLDSDPIGVGAAGNTGAVYKHAVPYQRDLVLFSEAYQAVLTTGGSAITPRNATVVVTSAYAVDTSAVPLVVGRTLMYPTPRGTQFFGVSELLPSPYTESQYVSADSTQHLPKYLGGRCRFSAGSNTSSIAVFAPSGDTHSLAVHEYLWDADQKVQQAWHTWTFEYSLSSAYFAEDRLVLMFANAGTVLVASIDTKAGVLTFDAGRRPFLDMWSEVEVVDRSVQVPTWLHDFDPDAAEKVRLTVFEGNLAGDLVGSEVTAEVGADGEPILRTVLSFMDGAACMGIPYRSSFSPSPPIVRDYNDVPISTGKCTLVRYLVGTKNTSEFKVNITDRYGDAMSGEVGTLTWSSPELELGRSRYGESAVSVVPCRTDTRSTSMEVFTDGTGELNVTSLEYVLRFHQKIKRR